jgi:hypothetical protein
VRADGTTTGLLESVLDDVFSLHTGRHHADILLNPYPKVDPYPNVYPNPNMYPNPNVYPIPKVYPNPLTG